MLSPIPPQVDPVETARVARYLSTPMRAARHEVAHVQPVRAWLGFDPWGDERGLRDGVRVWGVALEAADCDVCHVDAFRMIHETPTPEGAGASRVAP